MNGWNNSFSIIKVILFLIFIVVLVLILDYFNTFYFITKNLNFDFLSIFINAILVISIFIITYYLIDKKRLDDEYIKNKNAMNVLFVLLSRTYKNCMDNINLLNNQEMLEKYFIPKCDFNAVNDKFMENYKKYPFDYENKIFDLIEMGISNIDYINSYIEIKELYKKYVDMRITFFDIDKYDKLEHKMLAEQIKLDYDTLNNKLKKEIKKIDILYKNSC